MVEEQPRAAPPWWFLIALPLCAFAGVLWAFAPALPGKFLQWDDVQAVAANPELRQGPVHAFRWGLWTTHMGHFQPLSWASLALDVSGEPVEGPGLTGGSPEAGGQGQLGDSAATRCHRSNLWLHALGAVAFGLLAERLLRAARGPGPRPGAHAVAAAALAASLLWALHPLRVESVAWITERRDVLSAVPLLLSAYVYVLWAEGRPLHGEAERRGGAWLFVASLALLAVSLLAKAWGMVLPAVLVVLDFHPLARAPFGPRALGRSLWEKGPFLVLAAGAAVLAARAQASLEDAQPGLAEHTLVERALQACYGLCFYLWKSVVPTDLIALVELPAEISPGNPRFLVPALAVPAAALLVFLARRRLPGFAAAALVSVFCVAPVLGFFQAGPQLVADRYTYLHGFAFSLALAGAVLRWAAGARRLAWPLLFLLAALLGASTRAQSAVWQGTESLWSHVLAREPDHVVANLSLGNERARRAFEAEAPARIAAGLREAEGLFRRGLAASDDPRFATRLARVHDMLAQLEPGQAEEHQRRAAEYSEQAVRLAIATGRVKPETRFQRALRLLELDRADEALAELEWYVAQRPDDARGREALESARAAVRARR
ncbi:MAG: hypothetical protein IPK67_14550 [Planctomycetes bacterium]|nr:hypothetical protein [Planctomycetota bacterium]